MRAAGKAIMAAAAIMLLPFCALAQFEPAASLPQPLLSHTAVILGGRIYVSGGVSDRGSINGSGFINNVYYCATMNPDGTLGAWQPASAMPELLGLGLHASAVHNDRIYILGGNNYSGHRNVVYYSAANPDGTLTGWTRGTTMPQRVYAHSAAVYNGRIYVTGGIARNAGPVALVYSAPLSADGSMGAWRYETSLPSSLFGHRSFAQGGKIYVLGGFTAGGLYGDAGLPPTGVSRGVYAAAVNADGTLGPWTAQPQLPASLAFYGMVATGKSVYVLGGFDGGVTNAVYFSPIAADGALGAWQALHALPQNLVSLAAVSTQEYLYSIGGGLSYIDDPVDSIYFSRLRSEPKAFVKMTPTSINKDANGKWVTVVLGLPEAEASAVKAETVRISAVNGEPVTPIEPDPKFVAKVQSGDTADFDGLAGVTYLMLKFMRADVAAIIPEGEFSLKLTGQLADGRNFSGESMNRALSSKKTFTALLEKRAGERKGAGGLKVDIPAGAFKGNPELLLTAAPEEAEEVGEEEKGKRAKGLKNRSLAAVSEAFEFGPHGSVFEKPVTISLPYRPELLPQGADENALQVAYWNAAAGDWEILPSVVSRADKSVSAQTGHFSTYQVMAGAAPAAAPAAPVPASALGEVYVFPNPAKGGAVPVLHVDAASGENLQVKVFSASGRLAYEGAVSGAPVSGGAYELELRGSFPSGVYYYQAEVQSGGGKLKRAGKFAVVR
ncbi:MAG: hypothetical protein AB7V08_05830 [Elusimicrobiales bacterium]